MRANLSKWIGVVLAGVLLASGCRAAPSQENAVRVLAVETFLADMAQNVAGDRLRVGALIPIGVDPHSFEPTPQDVTQIAESQVLVVNGAGFEEWLRPVLNNAGGTHLVIEAAAGLTSREVHEEEHGEEDEHHHEGDPHFWLDPNHAIRYVENIRDGLSQADPAGKEVYARNADAYIAQLKELDRWVAEQVQAAPETQRLLVTNHESFGYFADRYGFTIVGTVMPGVSTGASPSAQQLAELIGHIRETGARAIFLETGSNPQLAQQIAQETETKVVTELYSHSITTADGPAPTYIEMIKYNTRTIVDALR